MRDTSGGALQGRIAAERSTPAWHNPDFAEVTSRPGIREPWLRANSPTTPETPEVAEASVVFSAHGNLVAPAGRSCGPGRYRNDGNRSRGAVSPAATSCGIWNGRIVFG